MADVEPEAVCFFWRPYIALGKLTLLEGDPEVGKSWLTLAIASATSTGAPLPGEEHEEPKMPGKVLLLSAEDDFSDTIRVRLDMLGADPSRITAVAEPFMLDEAGIKRLRKAITKTDPEIVIIDPLIAYTSEKLDVFRPNHVRKMMTLLKELADSEDCAILAVRHFRKSSADKAIHQGAGSIDYAAAARSMIIVVADDEDPDRRIMAHAKCSYARKGPTHAYRLADGLHWEGEVDVTANQLVGEAEDRAAASQLRRAMAFFERELAGEVRVKSAELMEKAKAECGCGKRTLDEARNRLGVQVVKDGCWWAWLPATGAGGHVRGADATIVSAHLLANGPTPLDELQAEIRLREGDATNAGAWRRLLANGEFVVADGVVSIALKAVA
jgi:hypothetical protein